MDGDGQLEWYRDANGDGINDVFLLNWLSDQLEVFYGITRMVFSEQPRQAPSPLEKAR